MFTKPANAVLACLSIDYVILMCTNITGGCVSRARGARLRRSGSERVSRERLALSVRAAAAAAAYVRASRLPVAVRSLSLSLSPAPALQHLRERSRRRSPQRSHSAAQL